MPLDGDRCVGRPLIGYRSASPKRIVVIDANDRPCGLPARDDGPGHGYSRIERTIAIDPVMINDRLHCPMYPNSEPKCGEIGDIAI